MIGWFVRAMLAAAAVVTEWLVAPADPRFGIVQGMVSTALFAAVLFLLALWPRIGRRRSPS
jgi:hypothetical protein